MKKEIVITLLVLSILLTSCSYRPASGEKPIETAAALSQVYTGTQGAQIRFLPDYPPANIYDTMDFIAVAEVWNKGAYDFAPGDCFLELTGYDKNILQGIQYRKSCVSGTDLEGKKSYNLDGSFNQVEFKSSSIFLPTGVNVYEPTLNLAVCYQYQTTANPMVCVENPLYQVTSQQKSCIVKDVSLAGQGSPVGVSYVDVEMAGGKVIFSITVRNFGNGRVMNPTTSLSSCPNTLEYSDFDKVGYSVDLSGGSLISCKPNDGFVRLTDNQGKILCSFGVGNTQSYETPLTVSLDYNYMDSFKKKVKIIKTPGYE